jgi:predicted ATP-binding protein involved in virulence
MKVKRLELKGFRGFDEIVLDFDTTPQRPTVFIGNNGVGKSSILDGLAILLSWFITEIEFDLDPQKNAELNIHLEGDKNVTYNVQKTMFITQFLRRFNIDEIKNSYDKAFGKITIDNQSEPIEWYGSSERLDFGTGFASNTAKLEDLLIKKIVNNARKNPLNSNENLPIITYYPVNRSVNKVSLESQDIVSTKPIDAYKNALGEEGIDFESFSRWFRNTEDLESERIRDEANYQDKQLVAVRNAIHTLIPEFDDLRVRRKTLKMTVNKNGQELTINQLSDGEKCLLAMVGDIARRLAIANPSLDDPLQGEGIVLIDEIELHLHPKWQRKIIPDLTRTFPNCQFIVTTHSPQVLSHVYSENIYILQSTPDGIIACQPESSYGRDSNQILENVMDVSAYPEEIEKELLKLFRLIDRNDLEEAKQQLRDIGAMMEDRPDDPQLLKAGVVIKRKEILGK